MELEQSQEFRSGIVALAGRPNVGKSTLVNTILGRELSIVTPKAQTTRNRITAIHTTSEAQLVLHDTPGIHDPKTPLNRALVAIATKTLEDADIVLLITEPSEEIHREDLQIIDMIGKARTPALLAVNKIDTVRPQALLPVIDNFSRLGRFEEIMPISALHGDGVPELVNILTKMLPPGPALFPEDEISDLPVRFFVAEIVREQITRMTGEEIPYKTSVVVESFKEETDRILIHVDVHTERDSQKKILIGKGGRMIKQIGIAARKKIEEFLEAPVRLELFVKVTPNWTKNERMLREFGYM
jgi:GTP-binding protein Era